MQQHGLIPNEVQRKIIVREHARRIWKRRMF